MDNFISDLAFLALIIVGLMVNRLQRDLKEIKKLLEEVLASSQERNQSR